tara:strand:+ start:2367 stop:3059 length:693 start_codon:yes stop_codon:yes gene_type:complete
MYRVFIYAIYVHVVFSTTIWLDPENDEKPEFSPAPLYTLYVESGDDPEFSPAPLYTDSLNVGWNKINTKIDTFRTVKVFNNNTEDIDEIYIELSASKISQYYIHEFTLKEYLAIVTNPKFGPEISEFQARDRVATCLHYTYCDKDFLGITKKMTRDILHRRLVEKSKDQNITLKTLKNTVEQNEYEQENDIHESKYHNFHMHKSLVVNWVYRKISRISSKLKHFVKNGEK